jgi:hypothetical protein
VAQWIRLFMVLMGFSKLCLWGTCSSVACEVIQPVLMSEDCTIKMQELGTKKHQHIARTIVTNILNKPTYSLTIQFVVFREMHIRCKQGRRLH